MINERIHWTKNISYILIGTMELLNMHKNMPEARSNVGYECNANSILFSVVKYCFATLCGNFNEERIRWDIHSQNIFI